MKKLRKVGIILGSIVATIALFIGIVNLFPCYKVESTPFIKVDKPIISAHRGGAELNPENTEKAFDYVILETNYTDAVEFDIRLTKDNVAVIIHDDYIDEYALEVGLESEEKSQTVSIKDYTYEELLNYNLGRNFIDRDNNRPYVNLSIEEAKNEGLTLMTLDSFLNKYKEARDFKIYLEIKDKKEPAIELAKLVIELLNNDENSWWKERTMVISSDDKAIDYIANNDKTIYTGAVGMKIAGPIVTNIFKVDPFFKPNFHCVQTALTNKLGPIKVNSATKSFVKSVHKHNQSICYWGVNTIEDMQKVIEIGADAITTDAPDKLYDLLNK